MEMNQHMQAENWNFKRHPMCNFTIPEELEFVKRYENGETFSDMAKEVDVSRGSLWKMVTQVYDVEPYQTSKYPSEYNLDTEVFSNIHNEKTMYLLGLIYSDGHIGPKQKILRFVTTDKEQMENFKTCLGTNKSHLNVPAKNGFKKQYRLNIAYRPMINDLLEYIPELSRDTVRVNKKIVNNPKFDHFLRGFFDGDGSVGKNTKNIVFTGKESLMKNLEKAIESKYTVKASGLNRVVGGYIKENSDVYHLSYGKVNACKKLYKIMYKDAKYFLSRKRDIFINHFDESIN